MVQSYIEQAILDNQLPPSFAVKVHKWYLPLAEKIVQKREAAPSPFILGVQGTQGSGKSTLSEFLKIILKKEHNLNCVVLSIDDFYLTKQERLELSETTHPLFKTRGVPGTHDISLAHEVLNRLFRLTAEQSTKLPKFSKVLDDRLSIDEWEEVFGPVDIIIFEGWCVGLGAQLEEELIKPVNTLEEKEDPHSIWRRYVNQKLAGEYQTLFKRLDCLAVLNAPSFSCVFEWRLLQEQKLAVKLTESGTDDYSQKLLTGQQVKRFIAHYQRLTEFALSSLPNTATWLMTLDASHNIISLEERG